MLEGLRSLRAQRPARVACGKWPRRTVILRPGRARRPSGAGAALALPPVCGLDASSGLRARKPAKFVTLLTIGTQNSGEKAREGRRRRAAQPTSPVQCLLLARDPGGMAALRTDFASLSQKVSRKRAFSVHKALAGPAAAGLVRT